MNIYGLSMYVITMHSFVEPLLHKILLIGKTKERPGCFYSVPVFIYLGCDLFIHTLKKEKNISLLAPFCQMTLLTIHYIVDSIKMKGNLTL